MTIDQLEAADELIDNVQNLGDMEHIAMVLAPRLMAEVWSLRGLLIRADKYAIHYNCMLTIGALPDCTCGVDALHAKVREALK